MKNTPLNKRRVRIMICNLDLAIKDTNYSDIPAQRWFSQRTHQTLTIADLISTCLDLLNWKGGWHD